MDSDQAANLIKDSASVVLPSVKELAKQPLKEVPERYLRADLDVDYHNNTSSSINSSSSSSTQQQVPLIEMSKLLSTEFHDSELHKLHLACKEWGFFQLVNHGVEDSLVRKVKKGVEEFFNMPLEEKKTKFWQQPEDGQGFGQLFVVSEDQKLEWGDLFVLVTLPPESRTPRLFPNIPLPFRDDLEAYCIELKSLAIKIIQMMGEALKIEPSEIKELFEEGGQSMRMNYYPPCPKPDKVIGLNPHSDVNGVTILLQANEKEGLQIKKDGKWVPINPLPHAFVVNVGDMFEILSNGIYKSIEHRATVNSEKERISIATFYSPKLDAKIGPSPSLVTPQTPPLFRSISVFDFYKKYFSRELGGKSHIDFIRIQNDDDDKHGST